jgi:hypothetical protein
VRVRSNNRVLLALGGAEEEALEHQRLVVAA